MEKMPMLSDGEFEIMECVWSADTPPTQTGIMHSVNEKKGKILKVATIATYIRRIMWKGYLEKIDKHDGHPTYRALISKEDYFEKHSEEFKTRWGSDRILNMAVEYLRTLPKEEQQKFIKKIERL